MKTDGLTGQAEIEFIVDRDGRVLFPRIVSASHEDFGWAAATAVSQWRFNPPMRNGQRVEVRMSVPILFDAQKLASSD
jgi:TonB family protein